MQYGYLPPLLLNGLYTSPGWQKKAKCVSHRIKLMVSFIETIFMISHIYCFEETKNYQKISSNRSNRRYTPLAKDIWKLPDSHILGRTLKFLGKISFTVRLQPNTNRVNFSINSRLHFSKHQVKKLGLWDFREIMTDSRKPWNSRSATT